MLRLTKQAAAEVLAEVNVMHLSSPKFAERVYGPCDGTALLMAALSADAEALCRARVCVDVGCGSGALAAHVARLLPLAAVLAADINSIALSATALTANSLPVHVVHMDLLSALRPHSVDVVVFHPPYVPTSAAALVDAAAQAEFQAAWAGGPRGLAVITRLLPMVRSVLSPTGAMYLLFYEVDEISQLLATAGLSAVPVAEYHCKSHLPACVPPARRSRRPLTQARQHAALE